MITSREPRDGAPDREAAAQAVLRLIGGPARLTNHERRALAALIVTVGELDHASLNPTLGAAYSIAVEALTPVGQARHDGRVRGRAGREETP